MHCQTRVRRRGTHRSCVRGWSAVGVRRRTDQRRRGERSAIGKALELKAALLADDLAARRYALALGLTTIGTLGVLVGAKRQGRLTEVRSLIEELRATGYWLGDETLRVALRAAGEG